MPPRTPEYKTTMKLPTTKPPVFTGKHLQYIEWKRLWKSTMGAYQDPVQILQLKESLPARTQILIGLAQIRSMAVVWQALDEEFLDYDAMATMAVTDLPSQDKKDPRFVQILLQKLSIYKSNLDEVGKGHRIVSDENIQERWVPLLPTAERELWLQEPYPTGDLWTLFEAFLGKQSVASRLRERMAPPKQESPARR